MIRLLKALGVAKVVLVAMALTAATALGAFAAATTLPSAADDGVARAEAGAANGQAQDQEDQDADEDEDVAEDVDEDAAGSAQSKEDVAAQLAANKEDLLARLEEVLAGLDEGSPAATALAAVIARFEEWHGLDCAASAVMKEGGDTSSLECTPPASGGTPSEEARAGHELPEQAGGGPDRELPAQAGGGSAQGQAGGRP